MSHYSDNDDDLFQEPSSQPNTPSFHNVFSNSNFTGKNSNQNTSSLHSDNLLVVSNALGGSGNITSNNLSTNATVSAAGNVIGANFVTVGLVSVGGTISASGDITGANVVANANVTGNNITSTNSIAGGIISASGNVTGGNLRTAGQVSATGNVTGNLTGNVTASTGTSSFNDVTINGGLNMNAGTSATITNLTSPTNSGDAATKGYVDTAISNLVDGAPAALDTLNELAAALNDDASFSTTVTNSIAAKLPLAGGTMTGAIAMGTSKITGLGNPTLAQDAATKTYVDTACLLYTSDAADE